MSLCLYPCSGKLCLLLACLLLGCVRKCDENPTFCIVAQTGLTPLMEAASGGYIDVGRVLLEKGAEINASPVPASRDTALTIACEKGHPQFVDLLLERYDELCWSCPSLNFVRGVQPR